MTTTSDSPVEERPATFAEAVSGQAEQTSDVVPQKTLRSRAMRASAWVIGAKPLGVSIQLIRSLVLTRLLFPEAFGLMALVSVVMQGLQMCSDVGIGPNIIHSKRGTDPNFLQTAWTLQIIRGVALWIGCCIFAWPVSVFYDEPMLRFLLPVAGLNIVIASFNTTAWATHDRAMARGRITIILYAIQLLNLVVMVLAAWWLRSVWALVIGGLSSSLLTLIFGHYFLPGIRHKFRWDRQAVHELIHFGKWIFLSTILTFFAMQMDKLMLGKLIPISLLGVYSVALVLANLPRDLLQQISGIVLFPALAEKFRSDRRRMHQKVNRARGVLLSVGLLLCLGVTFFAPEFFQFYDSRYAAAGWMAQLLALSAWVTVLNATTGNVLLALGDSKAMAAGNLLNVVVTFGGALGGFHLFGLPGFIVGYAAGTAAGQLVQALWIRRYGIGVLRQDATFTLIGLVGIAAFFESLRWLKLSGYPSDYWMQALVGAAVWVAMAGSLLPGVKRELAPNLKFRAFGWPVRAARLDA